MNFETNIAATSLKLRCLVYMKLLYILWFCSVFVYANYTVDICHLGEMKIIRYNFYYCFISVLFWTKRSFHGFNTPDDVLCGTMVKTVDFCSVCLREFCFCMRFIVFDKKWVFFKSMRHNDS